MSIAPAPLSRLHSVVPSVDARWQHTGVYAYPPGAGRSVWLQVTSGLSNPWHGALPPIPPEDPATAHCGAGLELCMRTRERSEWAVDILSALMARQQCVAAGEIVEPPLSVGDVLPLPPLLLPRGPEPPDGLVALLIAPPLDTPPRFTTPYGWVDWLLVVGLTEAQAASARAEPAAVLQATGGVT